MIKYNRVEYIKNYKLTQDEYLLLPYEEELAYTKKLYGNLLDNLQNIGDEIEIKGYLPKIFDDFFRINGISIKRADHVREKTVFSKVSDAHYEVQEYAIKSLENYIQFIAITKALVFETIIEDSGKKEIAGIKNMGSFLVQYDEIENILREITYYSLERIEIEDNLKERIIMAECLALFEQLLHDREVVISKKISKIYADYFRGICYRVEEHGENQKVLA